MAVAENAGVKIGSSSSGQYSEMNGTAAGAGAPSSDHGDGNFRDVKSGGSGHINNGFLDESGSLSRDRDFGGWVKGDRGNRGGVYRNVNGGNKGVNEMRELMVDFLSKLNPMAEEFVPPSHVNSFGYLVSGGFGYPGGFMLHMDPGNANGRRKKNGYNQGKHRMNKRTSLAQRDEIIRRTVYVTDIDQQVTEEQLAGLFNSFGQVVDCRVCGDPNSCLRFAFIEFTDEEGARAALSLSGTVLGFYPIRVSPSKTAIAPVNPTFLPRSDDEREMCSRTVYCTNIDPKVSQADLKHFFESLCGEVQRLRLLGDYNYSTRIAFVEFVMAESAIAALSCSGAILGSLPIRISPSKTPVRPRLVPSSPRH
ncbi:hypothetical protein MLD38_029217 [Melastoma candidum]|uniref:Uncharacterized protein n=1 Tax=Melastoma candidum TaxID=119954 RepID=A0ACB9N3X7_9MYRT|nr:hypothetical protein MLD38_029217 [Melastoma candidum]